MGVQKMRLLQVLVHDDYGGGKQDREQADIVMNACQMSGDCCLTVEPLGGALACHSILVDLRQAREDGFGLLNLTEDHQHIRNCVLYFLLGFHLWGLHCARVRNDKQANLKACGALQASVEAQANALAVKVMWVGDQQVIAATPTLTHTP